MNLEPPLLNYYMFRSDAMIALEVMAENVSVNKAVLTMFNLGRDNKSPVIRTNMTKIIDIVITR